MRKQEIVKRINEIQRRKDATEKNLEIFRENVHVDGNIYSVYLCGTDEMYDLNGFYQIGIDDEGNEYKFFFETNNALENIDYSEAYRVEQISKLIPAPEVTRAQVGKS